MTNKAMVAVCDILGFSNLVKERPLEEVINYHIKNGSSPYRVGKNEGKKS